MSSFSFQKSVLSLWVLVQARLATADTCDIEVLTTFDTALNGVLNSTSYSECWNLVITMKNGIDDCDKEACTESFAALDALDIPICTNEEDDPFGDSDASALFRKARGICRPPKECIFESEQSTKCVAAIEADSADVACRTFVCTSLPTDQLMLPCEVDGIPYEKSTSKQDRDAQTSIIDNLKVCEEVDLDSCLPATVDAYNTNSEITLSSAEWSACFDKWSMDPAETCADLSCKEMALKLKMSLPSCTVDGTEYDETASAKKAVEAITAYGLMCDKFSALYISEMMTGGNEVVLSSGNTLTNSIIAIAAWVIILPLVL